jgi:hypothetical protein
MVRLTQNDKGFDIPFQIVDRNNRPVNISSVTVKFIMRKIGAATPKINAECMITEAAEGKCKYTVLQGDLDTPGRYEAELEVTFGADKMLTAKISDDITIVAELG